MRTPLAPYRVPLLARLGRDSELELTVYHGGSVPSDPYGDISVPETVRMVSLRNIHWPGSHRVAFQLGIGQLLRRPADVVIVPDITHNLTGWVVLIASKLQRRRILAFGYGGRPDRVSPEWSLRLRDLGRRLFMRMADGAATYTERGAGGAVAMGMPGNRVVALQNTLDVGYLASLGDQAETDRMASELDTAGRQVLLFVGRFQAAKRTDILVDAFRHVLAVRPETVLVVVGAGGEAWRFEPDANTIVLGDIYDPRELAPLFGLADLLVIPGRIGLTCVHAFAYGVPVVTSNEHLVEQSPEYEYLENDVNAVIVDQLDAEAFAQAVVDLLADPDRLKSLGQGATTTARHLDMDSMVAKLKQALALPPRR